MAIEDIKIIMVRRPQETSKSPDESPWPTAPIEDDDQPHASLSILFFDGSTIPCTPDEDSSGFKPVDILENNQDLVVDTTYTTSGWIGHGISKHIIANKGLHDLNADEKATFLSEQWLGTGPDGNQIITNRRWLKRTGTDEIAANDNIFPVGCINANMSVTLLDRDGNAVDEADQGTIYNGQSDAILSEAGEFEDILGYTWYDPVEVVHVKVEEKTSKGFYVVADCEMRDPVIAGQGADMYWSVREPFANNGNAVLQYEIEGIFYHTFDTSDTANFKVTETPDYTAAAMLDPVVNLDSAEKTLRVFLQPRQWWGMARYSVGRADTCFGIWTLPPKDWKMPKPRKAGNWQGSHFVNKPDILFIEDYVHTGWEERWGVLDDSNAFNQIVLPGDADGSNGFWLFHKYQNKIPEVQYTGSSILNSSDITIGYSYAYPKGSPWPFVQDRIQSIEILGDDWFASWKKYVDDPSLTIRRSIIETFVSNSYYNVPFLRIHDGFWGSMPDGKIPKMTQAVEMGPGYSEWYPQSTLNNPNPGTPEMTATRTYQYLDISDTGTFLTTENDKIAALRNHFITRTFTGKSVTDDPPGGFLFGCAEAKAGDLVGVIADETDKLLYVWRVTDERLAYSGPGIGTEMLLDNNATVMYHDLVVGCAYMDFQILSHGAGSLGEGGMPCVEFATMTGQEAGSGQTYNHFGHIELEPANAGASKYTDYGQVPRMLRFGGYLEIPNAHGAHTWHPGIVDLSPGVRPLYYEWNDPLAFHAKKIDSFQYTWA